MGNEAHSGQHKDCEVCTVWREINAIFNADPDLQALLPHAGGYRYWHRKSEKNRYFFTVARVQHNGHKRYASGIYRYVKSQKLLKLSQPRYHAKKTDAMDRAYRLCYGSERHAAITAEKE